VIEARRCFSESHLKVLNYHHPPP